jgi:hypothetical protein
MRFTDSTISMSCAVDFRRAVLCWKGDNYSELYEFLRSKFQLMTEADKRELEEETARSLRYMPNNKKNATVMLFLQSKENKTTNTYRNGQDYDGHFDARAFYEAMESYYHRPPPSKKLTAFEKKLRSGLELAYYHSTVHGLTPAQYGLLMHVLNWLRLMHEGQLKGLGLQSLSQAKCFTNIKGSPKLNTNLHIFTTTLALYFSNTDNVQRLNPEIAQMVAHFGVSLDFVKGLTAKGLMDLIKEAKHHSRSGIIVPVYGTGKDCYGHGVFFARTALHFAEGIFGGEKKFEILPFQQDLYEELRSKYQSLVEGKASDTVIEHTFDDPKYCGKNDFQSPINHYEQRWRYMPNEGKPEA